jgi:hypothetical protein
MRKVLLWSWIVLCSLALLASPAARAEDEAYGEQFLPPETLLFFSIPSVPDLIEAGEASTWGKLLAEPKLQPFVKEFTAKLQEHAKEMEGELGVTLNDLLALPQGEFTFAVVEKPARKMAGVLLIDCGDKEAIVDTLLEKMDASLKKEGAEHSTQEISEVEVHVYKLVGQDNNPVKTLAYFNDEGYLVLSTEVAAIKSVLERWSGDNDDTLASAEVFEYVQQQIATEGEEPLVKWYLDPIGLVKAGVSAVQGTNPQAGLVLGMLPILGLDRLKGMGGGLDFGTEDFDTVGKAFIYAEQPVSGVLGLFQFPAVEQAPPEWVPADTASYFSLNWNAIEAYLAVESIVDSFQGPGSLAKILDGLASEEDGPQVHFKKDLIDLLSGRIDMVTKAPVATGDEPPVPEAVFALGVNDAAALKKTLAKAAKADSFPGKTREVDGATVYELPAQGNDDVTMSTAVSGEALLFATSAKLIDRVLRGETKNSLADSEEYVQIAEHFPKRTSIIGFSRADSQMETVYEQLKKQESDDIDLSKLPDFSVIKKHLRPSGGFAVPDKKGALFVGFYLSGE